MAKIGGSIQKCIYPNCPCPVEENEYPIGGYAPGNYTCTRSTCKNQFIGDKRAVQCEPCAISVASKLIENQYNSNNKKYY